MSESVGFLDESLPLKERVEDLLGRLSLEEKCSQLRHDSPAVERLGIPAHNWWNEGLHGVARSGIATVFPQAIGMAAMFDSAFFQEIATIVSDEARAKHHEAARKGDFNMYKGLSYWTPNINIFRDPRWGRGQETYGECPFLTARLGGAFVRGLQGDDPKYFKLIASPKHFAVHSGPEGLRHEFDAAASEKDLWETYLPAFEYTIRKAGAYSTMGAYNRTNGEPCCGSRELLGVILRELWQFEGYVVSDCWAVQDFHLHHKVTATAEESVALALKEGCDLNCGCEYKHLLGAIEKGLLTEEDIDRSLRRVLTARFLLGTFDAEGSVSYAQIPFEVVACEKHRDAALEAAIRSAVLLKNDGLLPLDKSAYRSIAVIGPNANSREVLLGNYNGEPSEPVTVLEGLRRFFTGSQVKISYTKGCSHLADGNPAMGPDDRGFAEAISFAERADLVVMALGITAQIEGEQGDASNAEAAGDRVRLGLPTVQENLLEAVHRTGKPIVLVLMAGSPLAVSWAHDHIPAILMAWYPGERGGDAIARLIFGDANPGGRLPITFPKSEEDLPPIDDYSMEGRTYRFSRKEPMYPFGFGKSYTKFTYENFIVSGANIEAGQPLEISITVKNSGQYHGREAVQLYLRHHHEKTRTPQFQLVGFQSIGLEPGASADVKFTVTPREMASIDEDGKAWIYPGKMELFAGGSQPDERSAALLGTRPLSAMVEIVSELRFTEYGRPD